MRIVEVLEDEHEEDEDDGGERPGDALHDGGAGGGVEDVGEEAWRSAANRSIGSTTGYYRFHI